MSLSFDYWLCVCVFFLCVCSFWLLLLTGGLGRRWIQSLYGGSCGSATGSLSGCFFHGVQLPRRGETQPSLRHTFSVWHDSHGVPSAIRGLSPSAFRDDPSLSAIKWKLVVFGGATECSFDALWKGRLACAGIHVSRSSVIPETVQWWAEDSWNGLQASSERTTPPFNSVESAAFSVQISSVYFEETSGFWVATVRNTLVSGLFDS